MQTRPPSSPSSVAETLFTPESSHSWSGYPAPHTADDLLIGTKLLDTYVVDRVLGEGGMGRIYEAHHARLTGKRFAIKVLRPELVQNQHIRARFEREVETVARVSHPGVLTVADVGATPLGWPYMVCEHLNGLDLLAYLRRFGALPHEEVVRLGCRISEALEATHEQGVIHRDVKPSNVFLLGSFGLLDPDWDSVKLIDFGLSRFVERDDQLTKTGIVMGTPAYMSPEQASGSRTDHLTDVYGVGAVLYAAATGVPPFREETQQQTLLAVINREPERPRALNASIPEELEVIIQRAMAKRPDERYPEMSKLRAALAKLEVDTSRTRANAHAGAGRGVRSRFLVLSASALLMLLAGLASAASGLMALADERWRTTFTERLLISLLLASGAVLLLLSLRSFERRTWANTARLSSWLPRLRAPLLAAWIAYGVAAFSLRFGDEVMARFAASPVLGGAPGVAWPGWSPLLALIALLAALGAAIRQKWWEPHDRLRRWLLGPILTVTLLVTSLAIGRWGLLWRSTTSVTAATPATPVDVAAATNGDALANTAMRTLELEQLKELISPVDASAPLAAADAGRPTLSSPAPSVEAAAEPITQVAALTTSSGMLAPAHALTAAVAKGPDGLESLSRIYANDPEVWKALALAHASRSSGLVDAVRSIERLLSVSPERGNDPDLRVIMTKAASMEGDTSRAAFRALSRGMGSTGPDLLYDFVLNKPELAERAKERLSRPSVRQLFSPELAIAYDLRFAPSCASRLDLLERADERGDQRTINVLSALVSKPPKCGRRGQPPCKVRCQRDAERLSRSIDVISRRLRASERAAGRL